MMHPRNGQAEIGTSANMRPVSVDSGSEQADLAPDLPMKDRGGDVGDLATAVPKLGTEAIGDGARLADGGHVVDCLDVLGRDMLPIGT